MKITLRSGKVSLADDKLVGAREDKPVGARGWLSALLVAMAVIAAL